MSPKLKKISSAFLTIIRISVIAWIFYKSQLPARANTLNPPLPAPAAAADQKNDLISLKTQRISSKSFQQMKYGTISIGPGLSLHDIHTPAKVYPVYPILHREIFQDINKLPCTITRALQIKQEHDTITQLFCEVLYRRFQARLEPSGWVSLFLTPPAEYASLVESGAPASGLTVERVVDGNTSYFPLARERFSSQFSGATTPAHELQKTVDLFQIINSLASANITREQALQELQTKIKPVCEALNAQPVQENVDVEYSPIHISKQVSPNIHLCSTNIAYIHMNMVGLFNLQNRDISLGLGKAHFHSIGPQQLGLVSTIHFGIKFHPCTNSLVHYRYGGLGVNIFVGVGIGM